MAVGWVILAEIAPREQGKERGDILDVLLDSACLDSAAIDRVPSREVDPVHGKLELATEGVHITLQEEVIVPTHRVGEIKVVKPAGRNCPKLVGRTQGTRAGPQNSLEKRSCSSSRLGRK